jgi:hypothetical protein
MNKILESISMRLAMIIFLISQAVLTFAQQPTHYPDDHGPIPPTLINILIFVGGPILLFIIYYHFRKRDKIRREAEKQMKAKMEAKKEPEDESKPDKDL